MPRIKVPFCNLQQRQNFWRAIIETFDFDLCTYTWIDKRTRLHDDTTATDYTQCAPVTYYFDTFDCTIAVGRERARWNAYALRAEKSNLFLANALFALLDIFWNMKLKYDWNSKRTFYEFHKDKPAMRQSLYCLCKSIESKDKFL